MSLTVSSFSAVASDVSSGCVLGYLGTLIFHSSKVTRRGAAAQAYVASSHALFSRPWQHVTAFESVIFGL
jgi:hypothetical protein